jgi:hypothetical protein
MREARLTPQVAALAESLSKETTIDDHVSSALLHAKLARQSQGNTREHHLKLADVYVSKALEHKGSQRYQEGHPLRGKLAALHSTLKGL